LQKTLLSDKYIKAVDLAGNKIKESGLKTIIKMSLIENPSIILFDARLNPGFTQKL